MTFGGGFGPREDCALFWCLSIDRAEVVCTCILVCALSYTHSLTARVCTVQVVAMFAMFGPVEQILLLHSVDQALVQCSSVDMAIRIVSTMCVANACTSLRTCSRLPGRVALVVSRLSCWPSLTPHLFPCACSPEAILRGHRVWVQHSQHTSISRPVSHHGRGRAASPRAGNVLRATVSNQLYPLDLDTLYVFSHPAPYPCRPLRLDSV
jgi:hypothetical protein